MIAKQLDAPYRPGERKGMVKVKRVRTADCVVVGWRPGKEEGTVGSLILGLYDGSELRVVGHTSGLKAKEKRELVDKLAPYETGERGSGDPSRWTADRDLEWVDSAARAGRRGHLRPRRRRPHPPRLEDPALARRQGAERVHLRAARAVARRRRAAVAAVLVACACSAEPAATRAAVTVSVSGDILTHDSVLARARALGGDDYRFEPMFAGIRPWIRGADLSLCHAETAITDIAPPAGSPRFNAPPALADAIAATGWDACSTASNHALDLGKAGVAATIRSLDRAGVAHTGTYTSAGARHRPLILGAGGIRVGLVSYTTATNGRAAAGAPLGQPRRRSRRRDRGRAAGAPSGR